MLHARKDYNRFQDPIPPELGGVPIKEPVFLLRAQDKHALAAVQAYLDAVQVDNDVSAHMVRAVKVARDRFVSWENRVKTRTPDMPEGAGS